MTKLVLMFIGVWIIAILVFLLFGAESRDIFNIFIANVIANIVLLTYIKIRRKKNQPVK
ncbi:hypothetical protein [Planococcus antarcticus]|uniref:hypothetical protein n=1 Tax=Planococcus antarcticus TaxID=161360 RepID=UPI0003176681|nr:hypothetical protein [Planococcus antarcticus]